MTETLRARPPGAEGGDDEREPFRPAPPSFGVGLMLRKVAGINEDILDEVPEERPRYSRLGAIVVATGLMAALSASVLLRKVEAPFLLLLPFVLFWGLLILCFDSWLVSSTHGILGIAKLRIFVPRLLISILMGAVIAEPLLLFLFGPAIETQVHDQRQAVVSQYESQLRECNPLTGEAPTATGCAEEFLLNIPGSPVAVRQEKSNAEAERGALQNLIADINTELTRREELARLECNGTRQDGTTGIVGEGPNCIRNRGETDRYRTSSNIDQHEVALVALNTKIDGLTEALGEAETNYTAEVNQRIAEQVRDRKDNQGAVGILDEHQALEALSDRSAFVFVLTWLVRLLLVTVDSLPVLTKLMSRTTTYDAMLTRQLDMSNRVHERRTAEREQHDTGRINVTIQRDEHRVRTQMEQIDEAARAARADRETVLDGQIEVLAAKLLNGGRDVDEPRPP